MAEEEVEHNHALVMEAQRDLVDMVRTLSQVVCVKEQAGEATTPSPTVHV